MTARPTFHAIVAGTLALALAGCGEGDTVPTFSRDDILKASRVQEILTLRGRQPSEEEIRFGLVDLIFGGVDGEGSTWIIGGDGDTRSLETTAHPAIWKTIEDQC